MEIKKFKRVFNQLKPGRTILALLVGLLVITGAPVQALALESGDLTARAAILINADTDEVLWSKGANEQWANASLTKMMTALLAVEHGDLSDVITVSANAASQIGTSADLVTGDQIPLSEMLYGLMLPSGNDAAVAIAEFIGDTYLGGDASTGEQLFVDRMNERAAELGMINTSYKNPHGMDVSGHYSTAADMAKVGKAVMESEVLREVVATDTRTEVIDGTTYYWSNTNHAICDYPGTIGVKTGTTNNARQNLVAWNKKGTSNLISVIMGASTAAPGNLRYVDNTLVLDYGYSVIGYDGESTARCQEEADAITYTGTWIKSSQFPYYDGGYSKYTATAGATATISFTGTGIAINLAKSDNRGRINVYLDDVFMEEINLYSTDSPPVSTTVYSVDGLTRGAHTLEIESLDSGTTKYVNLDYYVITDDHTLVGTGVLESDPADQYTLAFDTQGGSAVENISYLDESRSVPLLITPTHASYNFLSWNTAADGSGTSYAIDDSYVMPAADTTLYAIWDGEPEPTYTLSFDAQGGSATSDITDLAEADSTTLPAAPTRSGYVFQNWNTAANGSGTSYAAAASFTMPGANTTLYAIWEEEPEPTYTLSFDAQGGSAVASVTDLAEADSTTLPAAPTRSGYVFQNWNTAANGSGTAYNAGVAFNMPGANTTLYAIWEEEVPLVYTLSFDTQGGSAVANITDLEEADAVTLPAAPTRSGHVFQNWNTAANGSGTSYAAAASFTMPGASTILYAIWEEETVLGCTAVGADNYDPDANQDDGSCIYVQPTLGATSVSNTDQESVTLSATITSTGGLPVTIRGFHYGETDQYGSSTQATGSFAAGTYSLDITSLTCDTTYHFRAFATNDEGTPVGSDATFTTDDCSRSGSGGGGSATRRKVDVPTSQEQDQSSDLTAGSTLSTLTAKLRTLIVQFVALGGTPSPAMKAFVGAASLPSGDVPVRDLELGSVGSDVLALQNILIGLGYLIPDGPSTYFGTQTQTALASYQTTNGITPATGYFGPITRLQMKTAGL